ncbi:hypothetical protein DL771_001841 [Monosporascus sp. 5C6A]|nr:hypothetical protein DL771_001841 [Monosporascus sp. 5C6A]
MLKASVYTNGSRGGYQDLPERAAGSRIRSPQTTASSCAEIVDEAKQAGVHHRRRYLQPLDPSGVLIARNAYQHQAREINVHVASTRPSSSRDFANFGPAVANIKTTATLNLATALSAEY